MSKITADHNRIEGLSLLRRPDENPPGFFFYSFLIERRMLHKAEQNEAVQCSNETTRDGFEQRVDGGNGGPSRESAKVLPIARTIQLLFRFIYFRS